MVFETTVPTEIHTYSGFGEQYEHTETGKAVTAEFDEELAANARKRMPVAQNDEAEIVEPETTMENSAEIPMPCPIESVQARNASDAHFFPT
eukprot:m.280408 g.280408  ORF g.280408 m.280408 type:complete len:92 (+) comp16168_c0_seq2:823-1098(+)